MHAHERVNRLDFFAADGQTRSAVAFGLGDATVDGGEAFQVGLEARAERGVEGVASWLKCEWMDVPGCIEERTRSSRECLRRLVGW